MAEKEYLRLTRPRVRRKGFLTIAVGSARSSLWLGKDHLLNIDATSYAEEYKRFYFRDIQAFTIQKTRRHEIWNWVLSVLLILCLAGVLSEATRPFMAFLILIFAMSLLINNILGPTCAFYIRTAVQTEHVPSLNRIRRTRKVLDHIRPLIVAAQGQLTPEELSTRIHEAI